ncbi:hypothetical protein MHOL44478_05455 [Mycobacterium holsaticum DSM 44478]|uniref:hypothetical protein n=2 Tax=Mycolicibacterium holsaticum TaxID=152142 RepID=UPI0022EC5606|nr:hypothetical protein [Mycolicibacterium holsaticum]MDA4106709.1 hypothetical protein [Mycolicibacterium holsaticum DSM 44478 = JCM 12374]
MQYSPMGDVFLGSEALAKGELTEHQLRRWYRTVFRDVYISKDSELALRDRIRGAWLRSHRKGVISGVAASALHGASWVDVDTPIELISPRLRPQQGLVVRNETVAPDEITKIAGLPVTTPARTAFDLGRYLPRGQAVARLDALTRAAPFSTEDVLLLAKRYCGARGLKALRIALPLVDGGAASPRETWLRLLYIDAGLPKPATQIPIVGANAQVIRWADMGWDDYMVVSEYDGDQHRARRQYAKDIRALRQARGLGWIVDQVIKEDRDGAIIKRAWDAMVSRGWRPTSPPRYP